MKHAMIGLASTNALIGLLWYIFGGVTLAIGLGALALLTLLIAAFGLGSWWSSQLIERGASIALQAQTSDDRRDTVQMNALAGLVKETLKIGSDLPNHTPYPSLPFSIESADNQEPIDASFTIARLDEES